MNEYQKIFNEIIQSQENHLFSITRRWDLCQEYAWAIPSEEALDILSSYNPLVEMGAGGGYWAHLLRQRGVDILAYDSHPGDNQWVSKQWTKVRKGGPEKLRKLPGRTLFLCWPPYNEPMAAECLKNFRGKYVIYVGESEGGCTGDDEFHSILDNDYTLVREQPIPQWYGIHDVMLIYRKIQNGYY